VIVLDTSMVVAAALTWHESHARAAAALPPRRTRLIAHVGLETYSVLTRLPGGGRVPPGVARDYLRRNFRDPALTLPEPEYERLLDAVAQRGIAGGAVYDALVAATALAARATLLTLDRRALPTYELVGVDHRLV
jgi:predicted nucleic acid-binding protein